MPRPKTRVFLGPTLPLAEARGVLDADYAPPARRGDVLRALADDVAVVALIDGQFHTQPTVTHKEILYALDRGVRVYGAASLGALRAAELDGFGMRGVGAVYAAYRCGDLVRDDEVAVSMGPAELGFPLLSVALVDMRASLQASALDPQTRAHVLRVARRLHYPERTWPRVHAELDRQGLRPDGPIRPISVKAEDARLLLRHLADGTDHPPSGPIPGWQVTRQLARLHDDIMMEAGTPRLADM